MTQRDVHTIFCHVTDCLLSKILPQNTFFIQYVCRVRKSLWSLDTFRKGQKGGGGYIEQPPEQLLQKYVLLKKIFFIILSKSVKQWELFCFNALNPGCVRFFS
jgi:hypothetical protein